MSRIVRVDSGPLRYVQRVSVGSHMLRADEPVGSGGTDTGPNPYEFLLAALGTCASITVQMYADRKQWPLEAVHVGLSYEKTAVEDRSETRFVDQIEMEISFDGDLSEDQKQRLIEIANKCPVHRTLTSQIQIRTRPAVNNLH